MPREATSEFLAMLPSCKTQSTAEIHVRGDKGYRFTSGPEIVIDGATYLSKLGAVGELTETRGAAFNRVSVQVKNIDQIWGAKVASADRILDLSETIIRRYFENSDDPEISFHKDLFYGKNAFVEVDEEYVTIDVLHEIAAAGTCVAVKTLSPRNGWNFPGTPNQYPPGSGINPGGIGDHTCFRAGSPVWTPFGEQAIERIRPGYKIFSFDPATGEYEEDEVEEIFKHWVTSYLEMFFDDGSFLEPTGEHPIWLPDASFARMDVINIGQPVMRHYGRGWETPKLRRFRKIDLANPVAVYNLHVQKNHTYFVNGFGVHNTKPIEIGGGVYAN